MNVVLRHGGYYRIQAAELCLSEVTTNVAAWTELTNLEMFYFEVLAPPQILAQPAGIDVLFPFCCIVARLLGRGRNIKPLEHQIETFGTGSFNAITRNITFLTRIRDQTLNICSVIHELYEYRRTDRLTSAGAPQICRHS